MGTKMSRGSKGPREGFAGAAAELGHRIHGGTTTVVTVIPKIGTSASLAQGCTMQVVIAISDGLAKFNPDPVPGPTLFTLSLRPREVYMERWVAPFQRRLLVESGLGSPPQRTLLAPLLRCPTPGSVNPGKTHPQHTALVDKIASLGHSRFWSYRVPRNEAGFPRRGSRPAVASDLGFRHPAMLRSAVQEYWV